MLLLRLDYLSLDRRLKFISSSIMSGKCGVGVLRSFEGFSTFSNICDSPIVVKLNSFWNFYSDFISIFI